MNEGKIKNFVYNKNVTHYIYIYILIMMLEVYRQTVYRIQFKHHAN